tara:strand:+ start:1087 stop:1719 length:633 start_codon:yes stop_codon:yes gene_type:complete
MRNLGRVNELFQPNEQGLSQWISAEQLRESSLLWGGNGAGRHGIYFGVNNYVWETDRSLTPGTRIDRLRTNGLSENIHRRGPINQHIRNTLMRSREGYIPTCVVCGSHSELRCDHRNHLYNDPRVLNTQTQNINDFQVLCNHCNLQKRQTAVVERRTGIRYSAMNIPSIAVFGVDYIQGTETYNPEDINAMVGTYWYDPIEFIRQCMERS